MRVWKLGLAALFVVAASSVHAQVIFSATDSGAGPADPRPNSNAAAAQFDAAAALLGPTGLITFESAPLGNVSNLTVAPGVTVTGVDSVGNPIYINNVPNFPSGPPKDGFNTTAGGAKYLEVQAGFATFTFANPIQAFGAYITGPQPVFFTDTVTFNDGTSQSINVPSGDATSGGVSFVGFTDAGKLISQVTITSALPRTGGDFIGIDDVRYGPIRPSSVPEPGTYALLGSLAVFGSAFGLRRFRHKK